MCVVTQNKHFFPAKWASSNDISWLCVVAVMVQSVTGDPHDDDDEHDDGYDDYDNVNDETKSKARKFR